MEDNNLFLIISEFSVSAIGVLIILFLLYFIIKRARKNESISFISLLFGFLFTLFFYKEGFHSLINLFRNILWQSFALFGNPELYEKQPQSIINNAYNPNSWYNILLFFTLFPAISFLLNKASSFFYIAKQESSEQPITLSNNLLKNTIITLVLICSIFFSISSLIAIPIIKNDPEKALKLTEQLKNEVNTYSQKDSILKAGYIINYEKQEFSVSSDTVNEAENKRILNSLVSYKGELNSAFDELNQLKNRAVERMKIIDNSNIDSKSRLSYKSKLSAWYLENRSSIINHLNGRQKSINLIINRFLYQSKKSFHILDAFFESNYFITKMPETPTLGDNLGIFTFFSGWLLQVESYPLVIIIGLIGFGLLGASGSTFIKEQREGEKKVLIEDLAGVLIKGFTAAIVVFLGVQGSLAVLTSNTGNINAYALFFLAFVSAVFSDDAWVWAKNRFNKDFKTQSEVVQPVVAITPEYEGIDDEEAKVEKEKEQ